MAIDKSHKISQMPFIAVVNSYEKPKVVDKVEKKNSQDQNTKIEPEITIEEFRDEVKLLKAVNDRYVYACNNGTDEQSLTILTELMKEKSQKLDKISDKINGNLSLMHICAIKNKPLCMNFLAENKAKIDPLDKIEATPLLHAAANNCMEALAFLISKKANVNARDAWGKFPLQVALKNKHYKIAEVLASVQNIDIHQRGIKGNTVLHNMGAEGDLTAVQFLIEQCNATPQRRNSDEENVLQHSLAHVNIVQYLCAKTDKKVLLKMITNVNIMGSTVVHECCRHGYFASLLSILKSVSLSELTLDAASALLNSPDNSGNTPLLLSVKQGSIPLIKFLCQALEVKVNAPDGDGNTALYYAAAQNNTQAINMLTSIGGSFKPDTLGGDDNVENIVVRLTRSLRTLLAVILSTVAIVCIVAIAAISLGFFGSYVGSTTAIIRERYFDKTVSTISAQIEALDTAFDVAYANGVNLFNVTDERSVFNYNAYVFKSVQHLPLFRTVSCTKPNGALANLVKNANSTSFLVNYANFSLSLRYPVDDLFDYDKLDESRAERLYPKPGPLSPYIANTIIYNTTLWTESTISANYPGFLYLFLGKGFRDPITGEYLGACHFLSVTEYISNYLQTVKNFEEGTSVMIERSTGYLIGSSDVDEPLYAQEGNVSVRFDGTKAKNKMIAYSVRHARKMLGGAKFLKLKAQGRFLDKTYIDGVLTAINVASISDGRGLDWILIGSVPQRVFFGNFITSVIIMSVVGAALVVLSVLISIVLAHLFMRPVHGLIRQAEAIKLLQLEKVEQELKHNSYFSEIKTLQQAFQSMTHRLKQFRNFIPHHILAVIEAEVGAKKEKQESQSSLGTKPSESNRSKSTSDNTEHANGDLQATDMVNKALNSSLTSGNATIMTIKLPDYLQVLELHGAADIDETSKELLSLFMDIIRISKGQFVSITSTSAVIAWNTLMKQTDHTMRACKAARNMQEGLKKLHTQWRAKNLPVLDVAIAIARGTIYYGNMGTDRMKYFTVIGSAADKSAKMTDQSSAWGVQVLCDENVYEAIKDEFFTRPIHKMTTEDNEMTGMVYELGEARSVDAWVNEMNTELKETHSWKTYNEAFDHFQRGQYDEAYELFVQFLQSHSTDIPAQNMMAACQAQKDEVTPSATSENTVTLVEQVEQPSLIESNINNSN